MPEARASALDYAHRCEGEDRKPLHIVHRAVGPMRIRLGRNGRVQLTNFGAAWSELLGRIRSPDGLLRGDPAYIAPEILLGFLRPEPGQRDLLSPKVHQTQAKLALHIGAMAREARKSAGLTQEAAAELVGVATEVYGRLDCCPPRAHGPSSCGTRSASTPSPSAT